jgi:hypothetical protein
MNLRTDKEFRSAIYNLRDNVSFDLAYRRLQLYLATDMTGIVTGKDDPEYNVDRRRGRMHMLHDLLTAIDEARKGQGQ